MLYWEYLIGLVLIVANWLEVSDLSESMGAMHSLLDIALMFKCIETNFESLEVSWTVGINK